MKIIEKGLIDEIIFKTINQSNHIMLELVVKGGRDSKIVYILQKNRRPIVGVYPG